MDLSLIEEDMHAFGCKVVVVSFGSVSVSDHWRQETKCHYPVYSDIQRKFYKVVGLTSKPSAVWNIQTMTYYAEQLAQGKSLPQKFGNYEDDPDQMGGDFLVSKNGKYLLAHCSKTPTDRPLPSAITRILRRACHQK